MATQPQPQPQERGSWTSASAAAADKACPGRHNAQKGIAQTQSSDATFGDEIHEALAKQDPSKLDAQQRDIYESCRSIESKVVQEYLGVSSQDFEKAAPLRHHRWWIHWRDELQHSGEADTVYRKGTKAVIIDYKTLTGDVAGSSRNIQLRDLAVLYFHNTPMLEEVATVLIQPLVTHKPELCIYKREDLSRAGKEMHDRVVASNAPSAQRIPGEMQCKFCRAATSGTCSEYTKWSGVLVIPDPGLLDIPFANWTPEQCAVFLSRKPVAQKFLDDAYEAMKARIKADPKAIPGFELTQGDRMNTYTNLQEIYAAFSGAGGSLEQFMACVKLTKGDFKEAVALATGLKGKALDGKMKDIVGENFVEARKEPSITKSK